jgi:hypothetical protein
MSHMRTDWFNAVCCCAFGIPLLLLIGCGSSDQPELGTVSGSVTLDGKPLTRVEITFAPDVGRPSYGETGDDGMYELIYIRDTKGAKLGKHTITVRSAKVDNSKIPPAVIKPGKNRIDIPCTANAQTNASRADDDQ